MSGSRAGDPGRNALASETSPYLLQHARNPVRWYPWGAEALELARDADKPILLSIGYSACHWCHVMAHESFEDPETAALMNELFVNIKVDREERPDLDKIYQTAQYLLNQRSGGWPLTMFLTHDDHMPFAGGTYFPREPRWGMPAFKDLLRHVAHVYRERLPDIRRQNVSMRDALERLAAPAGAEPTAIADSAALLTAVAEIEQSFDPEFGGFGGAPKFAHPPILERLLRHYAATRRAGAADGNVLHMATLTMRRMAMGGIYDHLAGGFARYSVDAEWMIPHFEKMLYDNGPLLGLYVQDWQIGGEEDFRRTAIEIAEWVMREMQSVEGGYYSALDADSEGEEGKYYVWTPEEVRQHLSDREYAVFAAHFGLDRPPNFEGRWHLRIAVPLPHAAAAHGLSPEQARDLLDGARRKLLAVRARRVPPGLDDKILASWNALMIRGMAIAGRTVQRPDMLESARRALDFIRTRMWDGEQLQASFRAGRARHDAYLDDYAFLIEACLEMLESCWRDEDLAFARQLADTLLAQFEDRADGGFYFTSHSHEHLIQRVKSFADDAMPAGNGSAARGLARLGHLLGEPRYLAASERALRAAATVMRDQPSAHLTMLSALEEWLQPPEIVIIRADDTDTLALWRRSAQQEFRPTRMVYAIPAGARLDGLLATRSAQGRAVAYLCTGGECRLPVHSLAELVAALAR
ncbi:MAG: thioredoxin domain-containing protein [Gammaproteobacteria bacterium]|nr:thioredoxin domain-containing protein [Gammaproteobacteria bacterium]